MSSKPNPSYSVFKIRPLTTWWFCLTIMGGCCSGWHQSPTSLLQLERELGIPISHATFHQDGTPEYLRISGVVYIPTSNTRDWKKAAIDDTENFDDVIVELSSFLRLAKCDSITYLDLDGCLYTPEDFIGLRGSTIQKLTIAGPSVSDGVVAHLCELKHLTILTIHAADLSDEAAASICKCTRLEKLDLRGTSLSEGFLPRLAELKSLKFICVSGTYVMEVSKESYKKAGGNAEFVSPEQCQ